MSTKNAVAQVRETGATTEASNLALSTLLNEWLTNQGPMPIFKSCANCLHMPPNGTPAKCTKFDAHPPALVIVVGCPDHEDAEDIPF